MTDEEFTIVFYLMNSVDVGFQITKTVSLRVCDKKVTMFEEHCWGKELNNTVNFKKVDSTMVE